MSCIKKCLGVQKGSAAEEHIDNGVEWIFDSAAKFIRTEAEAQGLVIPDTLEDKLYRYGIKQGALPIRPKDIEYYAAKELASITPP